MLGPTSNRSDKRRVEATVKVDTQATEMLREEILKQYEEFIGAKPQTLAKSNAKREGRVQSVIFSDTHIPEQRMDLIMEICRKHEGDDCYIVGDVNDFESFSKHESYIWDKPSIRSILASTDAFFEVLTDYFPRVFIVMGNHDNRVYKKASRTLGSDYAWICQEAIVHAYESRHGVEVVRHQVVHDASENIPDMHYWHTVGDCILSHAEFSGTTPCFGVRKAHDFFTAWKTNFDLGPINVILQAHTHKFGYYKSPLTGIHCYEIGAMCKNLAYMVHTGKYMPIQNGYFHLVQNNGITDLRESRLYSLD
jgi:predicted phosphodiesterase